MSTQHDDRVSLRRSILSSKVINLTAQKTKGDQRGKTNASEDTSKAVQQAFHGLIIA